MILIFFLLCALMQNFPAEYGEIRPGRGLGAEANTFTGTMGAEGLVGEVSGTFSYE